MTKNMTVSSSYDAIDDSILEEQSVEHTASMGGASGVGLFNMDTPPSSPIHSPSSGAGGGGTLSRTNSRPSSPTRHMMNYASASGGGGSANSRSSSRVELREMDDRDKSLIDDTTTMHESVINGHGGEGGGNGRGGGATNDGHENEADGDEGIDEEEVHVGGEARDIENGGEGMAKSVGRHSEKTLVNEDGGGDGGSANDDVDGDRLLDDGYERLVGDVTCWFKPHLAGTTKEFGLRTGEWFFLNKEQILSAITVGINQVPEVCTSAIIAGVNPMLALQSTWIINIVTSIVGGGPGMVSGATTFIGLSLSSLVREHGVPYVFWAVMFAGILQIAFGLLGLGRIMRLIPRPLQVGFQNGMGLLLLVAQFRYARVRSGALLTWSDTWGGRNNNGNGGGDGRYLVQVGHSWTQHIHRQSEWISPESFGAWAIGAAVSFLVCLILPRLTRAIPSTFVAMLVASVLEWAIYRRFDAWHSPTIGDYADISVTTFKPVWLEYDMPPLDMDTFRKVYLHGLSVFGVGLMEALLTLNLVDELNEVSGLRNRVSFGQGISNVIASTFGGMGGSAMVGQSMVANKADGITGLSTFLTGLTMVIIIFVAYPLVNFVPLSAFAGIMFYASHKLIEYRSILTGLAALLPESIRDMLHLDYKIPRPEVLIMLTVTVSILAFDLSIAVCAGVLMAVFVYVWDSSARVVVEREQSDNGESVTYNVSGPLFFATAQNFVDIFSVEDIEMDPEDIIIMLEGAEVHDSSGMFALKKLHDRFVAMGKTVALSSLSPTSRRLMEKYASTWEGVSFLEIEEIEEEETVEPRVFGDDGDVQGMA